MLPYPKEPKTLGDHLRRRRHELRQWQKEVAGRLDIDESTYGNWEKCRTYPAVRYMPRLLAFLGCDPFPRPRTLGERLLARRRETGLSRKRLAEHIGIDEGTLRRYESGLWRPGPRNRAILERFLDGGQELRRKAPIE